jgi:hypothetical protein
MPARPSRLMVRKFWSCVKKTSWAFCRPKCRGYPEILFKIQEL